MHIYRVFTVIEGQSEHYTGKTILSDGPRLAWNDYYGMNTVSNATDIISAVAKLYDFQTFINYYKVREVSTVDLIRICYNYGEANNIPRGLDGYNDTWVLKRGI